MSLKSLIFCVIVLFFSINFCSSDALECITCDSSQDKKCITDPTTFAKVECTKGACFTKIDGNKVLRGCTEDKCEEPDCRQCPPKENACNDHTICKQCDSSKDPKCVQDLTGGTDFNVVCPASSTKCMMWIDAVDKHTKRSCVSEGDTCDNEKTCQKCNQPTCNADIFPKGRRECIQCSSSDSACKEASSSSKKVCLHYDANQECYTYASEKDKVDRGCTSDDTDKSKKCSNSATAAECHLCKENGCNERAYERKSKQKCIQCSGSGACMEGGQKADDAKECTNMLRYNQEEACFAETLANNTVSRGCIQDRSSDLGECKTPNCQTCDKEACNNLKQDVAFTCIRCRSDEEPKCSNKANELTGTTCRNSASANATECFSGIWNGVHIRGCMIDVDGAQNISCRKQDNANQCTICTTANCNTTPNAAIKLQLSSSIIVMLAILFWKS